MRGKAATSKIEVNRKPHHPPARVRERNCFVCCLFFTNVYLYVLHVGELVGKYLSTLNRAHVCIPCNCISLLYCLYLVVSVAGFFLVGAFLSCPFLPAHTLLQGRVGGDEKERKKKTSKYYYYFV